MSVAETAKHHVVISPRDSRLAALIAEASHRFVRWRAERKAIRELSYFSDAMLKDIGLTRGEISDLVHNGRPETQTSSQLRKTK